MKRALILFAHGARDPAWAGPFERLAALVRSQSPALEVGLAYLELMSPKLPELVDQLVQGGCGAITVVPIFLGQGGHVRRDLPLLVEELRQRYPAITLRVSEAVGEDDAVLAAMARYCVAQGTGQSRQL